MQMSKLGVSAVVLALAAGVVGVYAWRRPADQAQRPPAAPVIEPLDPSAPEFPLLSDVSYVDAWREFGRPVGFAYVPKSRPPGLTGVTPGDPHGGGTPGGPQDGTRADAYTFELAGARVQAFAIFSVRRTDLCEDRKSDRHDPCVRDGEMSGAASADPGSRHLSVHFTASDEAALATPEAKAAKRFWGEVEMVPVAEAAWFTDLVARAKAAVLK